MEWMRSGRISGYEKMVSKSMKKMCCNSIRSREATAEVLPVTRTGDQTAFHCLHRTVRRSFTDDLAGDESDQCGRHRSKRL